LSKSSSVLTYMNDAVSISFVKTYDETQDSTLGVKKRKIEEVTEVAESKPKKAKLTEGMLTATMSGVV